MISPSKLEILIVLLSVLFIGIIGLLIVFTLARVPWRIRRGYLLKYLMFWIGIILALSYTLRLNDSQPKHHLPKNFAKEWRLLPNGIFVPKTSSKKYERFKYLSYSDKPLIFITPTEYSIVQTALLTRLGQALFPIRHIAKWIIVQLPLDSTYFNDSEIDTAETEVFARAVNGNRKGFTDLHLFNIEKMISRFGIPYKLLSSDSKYSTLDTSWAGFDVEENVRNYEDRAYLVGLAWAAQNLSNGIVILGDEQFAYNSELFWELRKTRIASCWPLASPLDRVKINLPIADNIFVSSSRVEHNILKYISDKIYEDIIPVYRSGFALDLDHLRKTVSYKHYWKLAYDNQFSNLDFFVPTHDVQVMGKGGSRIYTWKLLAEETDWPSQIFRAQFQNGTNIIPFIRTTFGPRFATNRELLKVSNNVTVYENYDMYEHVDKYI